MNKVAIVAPQTPLRRVIVHTRFSFVCLELLLLLDKWHLVELRILLIQLRLILYLHWRYERTMLLLMMLILTIPHEVLLLHLTLLLYQLFLLLLFFTIYASRNNSSNIFYKLCIS